MIRRLLLPLAMVLNACVPATQSDLPSRTMIAESTLPPMKSFAARAPQSQRTANNHLLQDFLDLSFQMESGRELPVFTRFEQPISASSSFRHPRYGQIGFLVSYIPMFLL